MKRSIIFALCLAVAPAVLAENVRGVDRMVCSTAQAHVCVETEPCFASIAWELSIPDFVVIDLEAGRVSTTPSSAQKRSTDLNRIERSNGLVFIQGIENERAFSFVINEDTGRISATVARDGFSVTVFGACTSTALGN